MKDLETSHAFYDLHLHTHWSYDATAHPRSYFGRARALGVRCIAITDHHVLDSLDEVLGIAAAYPDVLAIPAAELTVTTSSGSVDLLCYGFPRQLSSELRDVLEIYHKWQRAAGEADQKVVAQGVHGLGLGIDPLPVPRHRLVVAADRLEGPVGDADRGELDHLGVARVVEAALS